MAGLYTQDDFLKAVEASGLRGQWSDYDWRNALEDPDWGMSVLSGKIEYNNASTDEQRALAHQKVENNRRMKGYSGGGNGGYYNLIATPASYNYESAPSFESSVTGDKEDLWNQLKNYGDFSYASAPEYSNRYDDRIQGQIGRIENYGPFSYDSSTDPLYSQYRKQYAREGRRATEDMLASASAASGGMPSSYAYTAAAQQGNYYAAQAADKIPELYQLAYNKYLSDFQLENSKLSALQGAEQADRALWQAQLNQYNTDRNFDYGVYSDKYNRIYNNYNTALNQENTDWSRYLDQVTQHNIEQNFKYNQWMDELAKQQQEQQDARDLAQIAAAQGDFTFMNNLGIDTSRNPYDYAREQDALDRQQQEAEWALKQRQQLINEAYMAAEYGDYSMLAALGLEANPARVNDFGLAARGEYAGGGGYSGGGYSGGDGVDYSGYLDAASAQSDFNPYDNAGTVAESGNLVESTGPYADPSATGDLNDTLPAQTESKAKTGSKTGNTSAAQANTSQQTATQKANENEASASEMLEFTMSITAMASAGRTNSEIRGYIDNAYAEGLISSAQRDKLKAEFPETRSSSTNRGSANRGRTSPSTAKTSTRNRATK